MNKQLIGITGGMGAGKSAVSRFWSDHFHLPWIDMDQVCRDLLAKGQPGWQALIDHFGARLLGHNREIDRIRLRHLLFSDPDIRQQVDALIHPLARASMHTLVARSRAAMLLVEIPLLFEAGWRPEVDHCVVVYADRCSRCQRLRQRDGLDDRQVRACFTSQMPLWEKAMAADHVLDNSGAWADTCLQILHLANWLSGTGMRYARHGHQESTPASGLASKNS